MNDDKLAEELWQLRPLFLGERDDQDLLAGSVTPCECVFCGKGFLVAIDQFKHLVEPCVCVATRMNNMRGPFRWLKDNPRYQFLADKGYVIVGLRRYREWTWLGAKNIFLEVRVRHFLTGLDFAHRVDESCDWSLTPLQKRFKSRMRKGRMGSLYFCLEMITTHIRRWEVDEINTLKQFHRHF